MSHLVCPSLHFGGSLMKHAGRLLLCLVLPASAPVLAAHAHVHGQARLDVAVDGRQLSLHLDSPLESLLGFEHPPYNAAQVQAAREMVARLRDAQNLFVATPAAGCLLEGREIESAALAPTLLVGGTQAPVAPPRPGEQGGAHGDLDADFTFRCARPAALAGMEVHLFQAFPRLHRLDVQIAAPRGQSATRLTPQQPRLSW
jgi:hypothetical protein